MMETKRTPGPWWNECGVIHAKGPRWTPENHSCIHVATCWLGNDADEDLIASAPDLYDALKRLVDGIYRDEVNTLFPGTGPLSDDERLAIENGVAALRKAEGHDGS